MLSLEDAVNEMIDYGVPEFRRCPSVSGEDLFIPYMMNDALECYYVLKNCRTPEGFTQDWLSGLADAEVNTSYGGGMLHLTHDDGSVVTLRYDRADYVMKCYRYHRIWHFWMPDHAVLRQLTYWVQTMADKWTYLGDEAVNEAENSLLRLAYFGPLRYYRPFRENLSGKYPDYIDGSEAMEEYAKEAGDAAFEAEVRQYRELLETLEQRQYPDPLLSLKIRAASRKLSSLLCKEERLPLIRLLQEKVREASEAWPEREYDPAAAAGMEKARREFSEIMRLRGCSGSYPLFEEDGKKLLATEELPFTIPELDYEDYEFRIQLVYPEDLS